MEKFQTHVLSVAEFDELFKKPDKLLLIDERRPAPVDVICRAELESTRHKTCTAISSCIARASCPTSSISVGGKERGRKRPSRPTAAPVRRSGSVFADRRLVELTASKLGTDRVLPGIETPQRMQRAIDA